MTRPYPRWRSWLSYLRDQTLEVTEGEFGDELAVVLRKGKLMLQSNGAVYSWEDNYYNFREAFERLDWERLTGDRVLVLGLGLGSIPQMLEETFGRRFHYTAVEYDEGVVELAEHYLLYRLSSPIETIVADAEAYVAQTDEQFDLILVDIFVDDRVPEEFESSEFLLDLVDLLAPGGCIISNRLTYRPKDREETSSYYKDVWQKQFPNSAYLDIRSNWMLVSDEGFWRKPAEGEA